MTKNTCLTWLRQKWAVREELASDWIKYPVEFNRTVTAESRLLRELIAEVEATYE